MVPTPEFLTVDDVLEIHAASLVHFGGSDGLRDREGLESAIAQPQATFDGQYLHDDLFHMAAVYAFHLAEAQAFIDGNKRTAVLSAVTFLDMNGVRMPDRDDAVYRAMIGVAHRKMTKRKLGNLFRELAGA
jgi:death-on-curing protein